MESVREEQESQEAGEDVGDEEIVEEESEEESDIENGNDDTHESSEHSPAEGHDLHPGRHDDAEQLHGSRSSQTSPSDPDEESDEESRNSRRSLAPSPTESLVARAASLSLDPGGGCPDPDSREVELVNIVHGTERNDEEPLDLDSISEKPLHSIKERVASDIARQRARQGKYHSKRSSRKIGRPTGSKAKQDMRVKLDRTGIWD